MREFIILSSNSIMLSSSAVKEPKPVSIADINNVSIYSAASSIMVDEPQEIAVSGNSLLSINNQPVIAYLEYTEDVRDKAEDEEWQISILVGDKSHRDKAESVWDGYDEVLSVFEAEVKKILAELMAAGVELFAEDVSV